MTVDYSKIFGELQKQNSYVKKGCVADRDGNIIFKTDNWDPSSDMKIVIDTWLSHGPRIEVEEIGYSVLRSEPEQLITTNVTKKGSIVGSITKSGDYFIAWLSPDAGDVGMVFMDVARAAAKME
ncbi:MAG: hypothetical protein ACTSWN_11530 [Promethearchaeota archaeon]